MAKEKNPLAHMLGAYFRRERNQRKISSNVMAESMGKLTDSFYRLIESGHALPQDYRIPAILTSFEDAHIHFSRIALYITGAHIIDDLMNDGKSGHAAMSELADMNSDFGQFYAVVQEYFRIEDEFLQKALLASKIANEVSDFLCNANYVSANNDPFIQEDLIKEFDAMPTLTLQLFLDFMQTFKKHPPLHISDIAQKWEEDNQDKFKTLIGIYRDTNVLLSAENLEKFTYPYLGEKRFEKMRMLCVSKDSSDTLTRRFVAGINSGRKKLKRELLTEAEIDKIDIHSISYPKHKEDIDYLVKDEKAIYTDLRAFWLFTMYEGNPIGFVGASYDHVSYVMNLSYRESINKRKKFELLWSISK